MRLVGGLGGGGDATSVAPPPDALKSRSHCLVGGSSFAARQRGNNNECERVRVCILTSDDNAYPVHGNVPKRLEGVVIHELQDILWLQCTKQKQQPPQCLRIHTAAHEPGIYVQEPSSLCAFELQHNFTTLYTSVGESFTGLGRPIDPLAS